MANTNEIILTQEGVEQLKKEYRNLIDVERPADVTKYVYVYRIGFKPANAALIGKTGCGASFGVMRTGPPARTGAFQ